MNIAIIGFGSQGRSVYEFYRSRDNQITICDKSTPDDLPSDVQTQLGDNYLDRLDRFELIFRSPSVHPDQIVKYNDKNILAKVTTNTNEFMRLVPTKNVIGVTGTKGKGTTSVLIYKMLQAMNKRVYLGGNFGVPPLDLLRENIGPDDYVVLELANFQLIDLKYSPHIGICLLFEPEHLDWHGDVNEYFYAKTNLFRHQMSQDIAIYYALNESSKRIASTGGGRLIPYYKSPGAFEAGNHIVMDGLPIVDISEIKLLGKHNWQNICAAITAVWQIDKDTNAIASVLREFGGLPFRIEFKKEINNVKYYNDSFSTAPTATVAAMNAIEGEKLLIIGGYDRGLDLSTLALEIKKKEPELRKVIIIGEARNRVAKNLDQVQFSNYLISDSSDLTEIVFKASEIAKSGDSLIFSPGFASFDMFKNFEDRGNKFNQALLSL